ncbi:MAG: hypothetical protein JWR32_2334 [Mycobacterium sp.]|jgi:hypothetical protein|nr:hypothetical protein [Mycobacterium sp.]
MQTLLLGVCALACPLGMCLMMWMMMRGERRPDNSAAGSAGASAADEAPSIEALRAEVEQLKAQQAGRPAESPQ